MKIDLHVHSSERSACSIASEKDHIQAAIRFGLDGLVFTDHDKIMPQKHLIELNKKYNPFKIYSGVEITIKEKGEDLLVIGLNNRLLEEKDWSYEELYRYVKEHNGFIILAHPYRYKDYVNIDIEKYIPDAIEIHSTNICRNDEERIKKLAERLNTRVVNNSDGHNSKHVGIYYNVLDHTPKDDCDLVKLLKEGKYHCEGCESRIKLHNEIVEKKEEIIKKCIQDGKDGKYYHKITGNWEGEFDRVVMGKTNMI